MLGGCSFPLKIDVPALLEGPEMSVKDRFLTYYRN
jgi:hypothetical protein